jgi:hypothetical protein
MPKKKLWIRQISELIFPANEAFTLLIKEIYSSETSVTVYQPTYSKVPEDLSRYTITPTFTPFEYYHPTSAQTFRQVSPLQNVVCVLTLPDSFTLIIFCEDNGLRIHSLYSVTLPPSSQIIIFPSKPCS